MSITYVFNEDYFSLNETEPLNVDPNTLSCNPKPLGATTLLVLSLILIINFLLAIPGNLLVGLVITSSRQVLTSSDIYLFHLTIADGLLALTLPFFAAALVKGWLFGDFMCKFLNLIMEANFYTSIVFLACISIDRYLVIVRANETNWGKQRRCSRILCAAVWVLGCTLALPALFNDAFKFHKDSEGLICAERFDIGSVPTWRITTHGFRHIFGFLIPLHVMIYCYGITVVRLLNTRGFRKHRAMRVILAVVIAFLVCWVPYHVSLMVDTLIKANLISFDCAMRRSVTLAVNVSNTFALLHSSINPFLYAFMGEKFRKRMMVLVRRRFRHERSSGSSRSTSQPPEGPAILF